MIEFVDTHSHLYLSQFSEDIDQCISNAVDAGVKKIVLPNIDNETIAPLNQLVQNYPDVCTGLMGLHPTHVKENYKTELDTIFNALTTGNYCGVGEIGIDLYWDKTHLKEQTDAFIQQVKYAIEKELPFVIHARDSFDEIFYALESIGAASYKGVLHAFTGNEDQAQRAIDFGLLLGIGGIVTFKNAGLAEVVAKLDINQLVLETDSPYLAPTPHRGKRNESSYIPLIAEKVSELMGVSVARVAEITTSNAYKLFNL